MSAYGDNAARTERIGEDVGFGEGPMVAPDGTIYVTSLDRGKVYRITESGTELFCNTGGGANGGRMGLDGTIYVAQNGGRRAPQGPSWGTAKVGGVQRITPDGGLDWLTRDPVAPNDLCFGPDGLLYVTDPTRALLNADRIEHDGRIWRVDPTTGAAELLLSRPWFTNGIAFDAEDRLYVADTFVGDVYSFAVAPGGLVDERLEIHMERGGPDGLAFDEDGNLVIGAISLGDGPGTIQTWSADGELLDVFAPGESAEYANIAFTAGHELVITDSSTGDVLLAHDWPAGGLALYPFRSHV